MELGTGAAAGSSNHHPEACEGDEEPPRTIAAD